jgi:spore photoproduct lyase
MQIDIKKIFIQKNLENNVKIKNFLSSIKNNQDCEIEYFEKDLKDFIEDINVKLSFSKSKTEAKKTIIFAEQKGIFIKKCPCTPNYLGCSYYVVELSVGCLYDCSYCYLQEYQNISATTFYVNFEKLFDEFDQLLNEDKNKLYRIGFGEYADSLFLDDSMNYTYEISDYLSKKHKNYLIEYKTKSNNIENILKFEPTGKEVIGWSINSLKVSEKEEKFASNFFQRLEAMKKCVAKGYFVAVHFDPVIIYENCEADYKFVIDEIYKNIDKDKIIWISIGSLRFNSKLKPIIEHRHPESKIIYGEFVKGADNKTRYFKENRIEIYKKIVQFLKENDSNCFPYFCMEDSETWEKALNLNIKDNDDIHKLFCERLKFLTNSKESFE